MRGKNAKVGATRTAANGYHYTRCVEGWRLTHHLVAEKKLGRKLEQGERVAFKDTDRTNFAPDNIVVTKSGGSSLQRRRAQLEARIQELNAELDEVNEMIAADSKKATSKV